jgi:ribosomal protein S18 acetylase RimI-like enzyme
MYTIKRLYRRASIMQEHLGTGGVLRVALNQVLVRGASLDLVQVISLDPEHIRLPPVDSSVETRFLTPDEVRRFAANPSNKLDPVFAERAANGLDLCFGAIHGDRLANYGWYALGCVEPEHAAGAALGLPPNVAYMYKVFTHPDFRGRRLNGACMGRAMLALRKRGIDRVASLVYWSNESSLRSCQRLGFRRLGLLVVGKSGPLRVPVGARRLGMTFGKEAEPALAARGIRIQPASVNA